MLTTAPCSTTATSTPSSSPPPITGTRPWRVAALDAGKDVYLEKPMTYTAAEGLDLIAAVDRSGACCRWAARGRATAQQRTAREIVKSGRLGQITLVRAAFNRNTPSGAWLYPIPPDASETHRQLGTVPRAGAEASLQPGAFLQVALLLGLFGWPGHRPVRAPGDYHPLRARRAGPVAGRRGWARRTAGRTRTRCPTPSTRSSPIRRDSR